MTEAVESGRGRWSTAIGLTSVVLLFSVFDGIALILLPLAIFLVALPGANRVRWVAVGIVMWVAVLLLSGGSLAVLSRGWGLVLGAISLAITMLRPNWDVTSRSLAAVAIGVVAAFIGLVASGEAGGLDATMSQHFATLSASFVEFQERLPETARLDNVGDIARRMSELRTELFPALLALQSVAALALVSWWVRRLGKSDDSAFVLSRMRDFRFNDQLIWLLIAGVVLILLPGDESLSRVGLNVLTFMGGLYVLRGLAVFVFLATGSRSLPTMVLGAVAAVIFYPVVFTAALLMGVGDTWLDVRRRLSPQAPV
jgi:hypothetical protein